VFIEKSGEAIRARTFIFSDPDGERELCLRPDLTVPTCRWHLAHAPDPAAPARYCYTGPVFRYDNGARALHPEEYEQVGLEWFGASGPETDATVLELAVKAVQAAGLKDFTITIGDMSLIRALLEDIDMPARWRARLLRHFNNPKAFLDTLNELSTNGPCRRSSISELVDRLAEEESPDMNKALALVEKELSARGLELVGGRSMEEIAARLLDKALFRNQPLLSNEIISSIQSYFMPKNIYPEHISKYYMLVIRNFGENFLRRLHEFDKMIEIIKKTMENINMTFSPHFGRAFDYYTGFVFQIEAEINGERLPVAGGGRYDDMLASLGGPRVPAAGLAIHAERLLAAAEGRARA